MTLPDFDLVDLYQEHKASEMNDRQLFISLMQALEGEEIQRERALALTYEIRDRSDVFE